MSSTPRAALRCSRERPRDHRSRRDQGQIFAFAQHIRSAKAEGVRAIRRDRRNLGAAYANVARASRGCSPAYGSAGLSRVRRNDDSESIDGAQPAEVLDRMMSGAEFAISHAGTHAAENDREIVVGYIDLNLLKRAAREEGAGATDEGNEARVGEARTHANHVLLGDADVARRSGNSFWKPIRLLEPTLSLQTATMRSSALASSISVSAKATRQSNVGGGF
jgi:hypothetical protein